MCKRQLSILPINIVICLHEDTNSRWQRVGLQDGSEPVSITWQVDYDLTNLIMNQLPIQN